MNIEKYEVKYTSGDCCSLRLEIPGLQTPVWVHNIYNPSPITFTSTQGPSTIPQIQKALDREGEHILLGDFNLHHQNWNNLGRYSYYMMADQLLDVLKEQEMELALPEGSITWRARGLESAIDLVFLSPGAYNALISYII